MSTVLSQSSADKKEAAVLLAKLLRHVHSCNTAHRAGRGRSYGGVERNERPPGAATVRRRSSSRTRIFSASAERVEAATEPHASRAPNAARLRSRLRGSNMLRSDCASSLHAVAPPPFRASMRALSPALRVRGGGCRRARRSGFGGAALSLPRRRALGGADLRHASLRVRRNHSEAAGTRRALSPSAEG